MTTPSLPPKIGWTFTPQPMGVTFLVHCAACGKHVPGEIDVNGLIVRALPHMVERGVFLSAPITWECRGTLAQIMVAPYL